MPEKNICVEDRKPKDAITTPGRCIACSAHLPGTPPIVVVSAYLHHSEGLSDANLGILARLGTQLSDVGQPWVLGADFNFEPSELESSSFVAELRASLISPKVATHYPCGPPTTFDFFVCSGGLAQGVMEIETQLDTELSPHRPVQLKFFPQLAVLKALSFRKPPPLALQSGRWPSSAGK